MQNENIKTVQNIYEAFGIGDVNTIVNSVSDDVVWIDPGYPDLPFGSEGRTKNQIPDFFQSLGTHINYTKFEPREFIADKENVIVLGYHEGTITSTGKNIGQEWVMVWKFNDTGKVKYYRAHLDTNQLVKAFKN
jgi:uncharacterized protein